MPNLAKKTLDCIHSVSCLCIKNGVPDEIVHEICGRPIGRVGVPACHVDVRYHILHHENKMTAEELLSVLNGQEMNIGLEVRS